MQAVAAPPATVATWLDGLPDGPFKEDVQNALQRFEGLDPGTLDLLAHNFLANAPRCASAVAAYALAGWGPAGVAARMAELYPDDESVKAAFQTALRLLPRSGKPSSSEALRESLSDFRTAHRAALGAIASGCRARRRAARARVRATRPIGITVPRSRGCHMARAICGGSDDGDGSGDGGEGPSDPPVPTPAPLPDPAPPAEPSDPHTKERKRLLAEFCACCGASLCDAVSVSFGVGPSCRRNLGLTGTIGKRLLANETVALVVEACERADAREALRLVSELRKLDPGYLKLADRVEKRWLGSVKFLVVDSTSNSGTHLSVKTPYSPEFVQFCRYEGFRWLPKPVKKWHFPAEKLPDVLSAIGKRYGWPAVLSTDLKRYETNCPTDSQEPYSV